MISIICSGYEHSHWCRLLKAFWVSFLTGLHSGQIMDNVSALKQLESLEYEQSISRVWAECNQSMSKASLQGSAPPATAARPRPLLVETILNISRILLHTMYIWLLEAGNLARSVPQGSSRICIGLLGALEYESGKHFLVGALLTSQVVSNLSGSPTSF